MCIFWKCRLHCCHPLSCDLPSHSNVKETLNVPIFCAGRVTTRAILVRGVDRERERGGESSWSFFLGGKCSPHHVCGRSSAVHQAHAAVVSLCVPWHPEKTHAAGQRVPAAQHSGCHQRVRDRARRWVDDEELTEWTDLLTYSSKLLFI